MNGWVDPGLNLRTKLDAQGREQAESKRDLRKALDQLHRSLPALAGEEALRAWGLLGNWHRLLHQSEQALRCHDEAVQLADGLGMEEAAFRNRIGRARARQYGGALEDALKEMEALIDQADADGRLASLRHFALQHAGKCALELDLPVRAKAYLERALILRKELGNADWVASTEAAIELLDNAFQNRSAGVQTKGSPSDSITEKDQKGMGVAMSISQLLQHNRKGWNRWARSGGEWSQPYGPERFEAAVKGDVHVVLTPNKRVPQDWLGPLQGANVLGLASGGGQQLPLFAAAGASVTSFDLSDAQLARDKAVAAVHGLHLDAVQGNMADLSALPSNTFDLIFHPVSNVFAPDLKPVWREAFRVLKPGGRMLSGMMQPVFYCFDHQDLDEGGPLTLRHSVPYSDLKHMPEERLQEWLASGEVLEFGHSLEQLIGLPLEAGFVMTGFYDDDWSDEASRLNPYFPIFLATRLVKPLASTPV